MFSLQVAIISGMCGFILTIMIDHILYLIEVAVVTAFIKFNRTLRIIMFML